MSHSFNFVIKIFYFCIKQVFDKAKKLMFRRQGAKGQS